MDEDKLLVLMCHEGDGAICFKTTSNTDYYDNNTDAMVGVVLYEAGTACFNKRTVVEPHNYFLVRHEAIDSDRRIIGTMPEDFHQRLVEAVRNSVVLTGKARKEILRRLEGDQDPVN